MSFQGAINQSIGTMAGMKTAGKIVKNQEESNKLLSNSPEDMAEAVANKMGEKATMQDISDLSAELTNTRTELLNQISKIKKQFDPQKMKQAMQNMSEQNQTKVSQSKGVKSLHSALQGGSR